MITAVVPASAASPAAAGNLKVNANPAALGMDDATPTLSWVIASDARGVQQTQYRVGVATTAAKAEAGRPDVWDSGTVTSDATAIDYTGPGLAPRTRYYWSVKVWAPGAGSWSTANVFETAYLNEDQWQGDWISGEPRSTAPVTDEIGAADDAGLLPSATVTAATTAGASNIRVDNVAGAAVGDSVVVGLGGAGETVQLTEVGTATASTTVVAAAAAAATRLYVGSVAGIAVGSVFDVGGKPASVTEVGTTAQRERSLAAPVVATDTNLKVSNIGGFTVGQAALIGTGTAAVIRTVTEVGTATATGTGVTVDAPVGVAFANGAPVRALGTGLGITALPVALAPNAIVVSIGTGLSFTPQLTNAWPIGTTVRRPGAEEICRPVGNSLNAGACKPVRPDYLMRKAFDVAPVSQHGKVVKARLYSTGLGWNEPRVNGELTQPGGHLNPGFTDYEDTVQYTTDDITPLIKQAQSRSTTNVVASEIAAGRYNSESVPSNHRFETAQWRNLETLRADLYVTYADGTEQLVRSDESWSTSTDGPTRYADFDNGETFDARKKIADWDTTSFDSSTWTTARTVTGPVGDLVAMEQEATKVVDEITGPFPSYRTAAGAQVFDVQRQYAGWATAKVWGARPGQVIRFTYVERRNDDLTIDDPALPGTGQDGELQLAGSLQQQYYVSDGSGTAENPETFAPNWNFAGFQWVQVDGTNGARLPDDVKVDVASVQQVRTAQPVVGTFETDVPLLNQIYANVKGSVEGNWISGYSMDTPTYEKDGWTGDAQIILPTVANIFDIQRSMQKSAQDSVDSQLENGQVGLLIPGAEGYGYCSPTTPENPEVYVPCGNAPSLNVFKSSGGGATPIWDAFLMVTSAEAYLRYDDLRPIETAYGAMTKYLDVNLQGGKPYSEGPGGWFLRDGNLQNGAPDWTLTSGLGDWAFVTGADGNAEEGTDLNVGGFQAASSTAFTAFLATTTADAARALYESTGDAKYLRDAGKYETLFEEIRADFNARWWDEERGFYAENATQELRQGFQAWAIGFGLVEEKNKRALEEKLAYDVAITRTGHAMVGFVGIRWIWPVLSDAAHDGVPYAKEALFKVAQQTTYPSYGYHIGLGYTGVGEYWEASTRTRNHQFQGSIGQWFYEELAGIKPAAPGYKKISIRPLVGGEYGVHHVAATHETIHGTVASDWQDDGVDGLTLDVTIPANTTAKVYVPGDNAGVITEGDVLASEAAGVKLIGQEADAVVYEVASGSYSFARSGAAVTPDKATTVTPRPARGTYGKTIPVIASVVDADGAEVTTGSLVVISGETTLASASVEAGTGRVTLPVGSLPAGDNSVRIVYSGADGLTGSEASSTVTVTRAKARLTATVAPKKATPQSEIVISARVTATGAKPTGTVTVERGGAVVGEGTLSDDGGVSITVGKQPVGIANYTVRYLGDPNVTASARAVKVTVT